MNRSTHWVVPKTAVVTASIMLAFFLPVATSAALTEPCGLAAPSASGYFFSAYESVSYTPEGYLELHFKNQSRYSDGRGFSVSWTFVNDECVGHGSGSTGMSMPTGVTDWSIRFTSPSHFDLWDDTNSVIVVSRDIAPAYPNYTRISFRGSIDGGASFVNSRTFKIYQPGLPPEFPDTAVKSDSCPDIAATGYYFDSYEQAEYVDGLLRVHVRFKTPYNDGRTFRLSGLSADDPCSFIVPSYLANPDASVTPRVRYYSFRMTSPTHWVMWDDENDVAFTCANCSGDILEGSAHVLWYGTIDSNASTMRTTPLPPTLAPPRTCCSSVLFLPGLKGSRLVLGSDTLWPPTVPGGFSEDIEQLELNSDGASINDVKVDGVLETFYTTPVYSGFTSYLDQLVTNDVIRDWEPLPYDWRLSPERIVEDGVELETGILNLADEVERVAEESYSDKVMIVAHSYGGLVAKALIAELVSRGKDQLVESLVLVGSPQLGTPQAAASMLHGAGESIGLGYIVNPVTSRQVALNMESAYHLLPSQMYFSRVTEPVVTFDPDSGFTEEWRNFWGPGISNYVDFFGFVTGAGVLREDPDPQTLRIPEIANPTLLTNANTHHNTYDTFAYPPNINVVQIAGWGLPTVKSVEYTTQHFLQSYRSIQTIEGDGTVVYPSAIVSETGYYFNLFDFNKLPGPDYQHRDLLSIDEIEALIESLLKSQPIINTGFITSEKPLPDNMEDQILISSFSPIVFGAYDSQGRFTGVDPNQDLTSELLSIKQEIPGSYFLETGESNSIYLPSTGEYSFVVKGLDSGPASIEVSTFSEASTTLTALFKDFEVSDTFTGSFLVNTSEPKEVQLTTDTDGDGTTDAVLESDLKKKPITVTADPKQIILGAAVPTLTYSLSGFVGEDTAETTVTGSAECTTTPVSTVGSYPITCLLGSLSSSKYEFTSFINNALTVTYSFSGFLKPINDPAKTPSVFKVGGTVPVKFTLSDVNGRVVQSATPPEWLPPVKGDPLTVPRNEKKYHKRISNGEVYQWKPKQQFYQYNWNTKGYEPGYWYEISAKLDDGTIKLVIVGLK